ncbi:hypothetical protein DVH24_037794 [Malus domestica]|uniref:Uncharacterized protein n=1 Tax=Malus domestica TaxID=3750 RepID=A0A498JYD4_MALDO|nr:hypothetical protein DVH24_037794 [Malus domestica]
MATLKLLPNLVAAMKKCRAYMPQGGEDLYDESNKESSNRLESMAVMGFRRRRGYERKGLEAEN